MISPLFNAFAVVASTARLAEAAEHLREQEHELANPDESLVEVLVAAGLSGTSPVDQVVAALAGRPDCVGILEEWVDYRFSMRTNRAVHARYFRSHEPDPLYTGTFTDRVFAHVTLDTLEDSDLWRCAVASPGGAPHVGPRLRQLSTAMWRHAQRHNRARRNILENKRRKLAAAGSRLNDDTGLLDASVVEHALVVDRKQAADALQSMQTRWETAAAEQRQQAHDMDEALALFDVAAVRSTLVAIQNDLEGLQRCDAVKAETLAGVDREFTGVVRGFFDYYHAKLTAAAPHVADEDVSDVVEAAKKKNSDRLALLVARKKEAGATAASLRPIITDWLMRCYTSQSRALVRGALHTLSALASAGRDALVAYDRPRKMADAMSRSTARMVTIIDAMPAVAVDMPEELAAHLHTLTGINACEHIRDTLGHRLLDPKAKYTAKTARAAIVAALVAASANADKVMGATFTTSAQFVEQQVKAVDLGDAAVALILLEGKTADQLLVALLAGLDGGVVPELAKWRRTLLAKHAPIPVLVDMDADRGGWRVEVDVVRAFVDSDVQPALEAVRERVELGAGADALQHKLWFGDVQRLVRAASAPTFRVVFQAARALLQLQLLFP